ncbi:translation initiation factor [Apiospora phragmitis]|uniref:Translation initiation factor n=1 Tax=Apiospora phragmitis TaxID=2905665 RepID=A0ABR1T3U1_9PEZI
MQHTRPTEYGGGSPVCNQQAGDGSIPVPASSLQHQWRRPHEEIRERAQQQQAQYWLAPDANKIPLPDRQRHPLQVGQDRRRGGLAVRAAADDGRAQGSGPQEVHAGDGGTAAGAEGGGGGEGEEADEVLSFQDMPLAEPEAAICKVIDKFAYAKYEEEKEKEAKRKKKDTKELEINWAIAPHDFGFKLGQLEKFLSKGKTVEVMLSKKRGGRVATKEEAQELLEKLETAATGAEATVTKREGQFPGLRTIHFKPRKDG